MCARWIHRLFCPKSTQLRGLFPPAVLFSEQNAFFLKVAEIREGLDVNFLASRMIRMFEALVRERGPPDRGKCEGMLRRSSGLGSRESATGNQDDLWMRAPVRWPESPHAKLAAPQRSALPRKKLKDPQSPGDPAWLHLRGYHFRIA
jgi:hypothetical protein